MTDPEAVDRDEPTIQTATADELRAIIEQTADGDLRLLARRELTRRRAPEARRPAESQRRQADPSTAREVVLQEPAPEPLSRAEIRAARRFRVVTYDGRVIS